MQELEKKNLSGLKMEEHYSITFDVYGYRLFVIYTDDLPKTRESLNSSVGAPKDIITPWVDGLHCYNKLNSDGFILFTPKTSIGTIAHEVSHAIWRMFQFYGAKFENELFAYHLGYTLDKILEFKNEIDNKNTPSIIDGFRAKTSEGTIVNQGIKIK